MNADEHADTLVAFHKRLTDGGLGVDVANVLTIEVHKSLTSGAVTPTAPTKADQADAIKQAALEKRERREAERQAQQ